MNEITRAFIDQVAIQLELLRQRRREQQRKYRQRRRLQADLRGQQAVNTRSTAS